ncbi:hypothetical protein BJ138DRAFT_1155905 [Hygrophoropsis aurantiaca]|uniref:Uncharacterized protein n=1 Tax=Hygrophoropsis aurantiaca TaxID=72124 RepID=A0ACB8A7H5_9AGAM|nr:hypothetical protein BJ138DRAFT_1155905 [Hygrophoropsis aurantiaca]
MNVARDVCDILRWAIVLVLVLVVVVDVDAEVEMEAYDSIWYIDISDGYVCVILLSRASAAFDLFSLSTSSFIPGLDRWSVDSISGT